MTLLHNVVGLRIDVPKKEVAKVLRPEKQRWERTEGINYVTGSDNNKTYDQRNTCGAWSMAEALEREHQLKKGQPCQFLSSFTRKTFDPQSFEKVATALLPHQ